MRSSLAIGICAFAGLLIGSAIGGFVGWASTNPIHFEMEARQPPTRYEAMLRDLAAATKTSKGAVGTAMGVVVGGPLVAFAGTILAKGFLHITDREPRRHDPPN